MYRMLQRRLADRVRGLLRTQYGIEQASVVVDQPPNVALGEYALPLAFELAKQLRKPPRKIAEELVAGIGVVPGFHSFEVAGAGYINARVNRGEVAAALAADKHETAELNRDKILVEHTSINPNKAAHIGHLRNAVLGDTFVRLLRADGRQVDVQNYIDNTGVQVADVVVGFAHLEKKSKDDVAKLIATGLRFDYTCWDLYARVSQWYAEDKSRDKVRLEVLHAIEKGGNDLAEIADLISTDIMRRHLHTMQRLDITYDFLPRESEILRLHFWDAAFALLKESGVLYFEKEGKNAGCWVMRRAGAGEKTVEGTDEAEDQKVIVRSNNTVTYVGKDIAYHLWKFGLLGKDFAYRRFYEYPDGQWCWVSAETGERDHPHFGGVGAIYNVIDARQSDPQNQVREAIRELGDTEHAENYHHFSYEMVALTPRCAAEMGYDILPEDMTKAYIEVSGRRGFGVKADDLIDTLIHSAAEEVTSRHAQLEAPEQRAIAEQIAIGALRYFMLRYTKNSVIAFDFKDALSFEGETGPYAQYAAVRAGNIFRKGDTTAEAALAERINFEQWLSAPDGNDLWELWLAAAKLSTVVEQCIATTEPAHMAKYAFQLAQQFSNFYHRHHILNEADPERKKFLLATAAVVRRELARALDIMGIQVPPVM
ncbi:MAG: arginine--tRNA ligase [Candidatus Koribacter versatilis]|uniref:arginine--tRNA ligase n=1 Tax=Candidatus Korobacter versatilis TaxID=658062 RepID=A0A932A843_9BACT|nr:arginine--tRNA ligase [Candidatus Koribacter versatilis]